MTSPAFALGSSVATAGKPVAALLVTVMAASVATRQLPPGYVDPAPVLDAAAKAIGTANLPVVPVHGRPERRTDVRR